MCQTRAGWGGSLSVKLLVLNMDLVTLISALFLTFTLGKRLDINRLPFSHLGPRKFNVKQPRIISGVLLFIPFGPCRLITIDLVPWPAPGSSKLLLFWPGSGLARFANRYFTKPPLYHGSYQNPIRT